MKQRLLFFVLMLGWAWSAQATTYSCIGAKPEAGWAGQYLIVYELSSTQAYVWNGEDASGNYVTATITNGQITANDLDAYLVTVTNEGSNKYGVKAADGFISTSAKKNGITYSQGAVDCTIQANGGYVILETNTNTCRFVYHNTAKRFRFYYDDKKKWADTDYKNIKFYVKGNQGTQPATQNLDINYAQAELYACQSKFPTQSNPYNQYFATFLWLLQQEDENAVPQIGLEILAPTQYSIAGHYQSDYTDGQKYYIHITGGSQHSYFTFPSKAEEGYSTASITVAEMDITKVGPSVYPNAYVYHIKLEFTDSNRKIWILDKDLDVYAWWIDCDRSGKENQDMEPVAFTLESGNHNDASAIPEWKQTDLMPNKILHKGSLYILHQGKYYTLFGQPLR